jgi:hypothetical protein
MRFAGIDFFLRSIFNLNLKFLRWRYHDVIMAVGGEDDGKNIFKTGKWTYVKLP